MEFISKKVGDLYKIDPNNRTAILKKLVSETYKYYKKQEKKEKKNGDH